MATRAAEGQGNVVGGERRFDRVARVDAIRLLIVALGEFRLGLPLARVERVVHAVEVAPLARAPDAVLGVVNLHGEIVPVLDPRQRFGIAARPLQPEDLFVIVRLPQHALALLVDDTHEVEEFDADRLVPAAGMLPSLHDIAGVIRLEDGLLVVDDPDRFLDVEDWNTLVPHLEAGG